MNDMSRAQRIGLALQGFGAGISGQGPQFQQNLMSLQQIAQQQQLRQQEQMLAQRQAIEETFFKDIGAMDRFAEEENWDAIVNLGTNRLSLLQQFPNADPSNTQELVRLAMMAQRKDSQAGEMLKSLLGEYRIIGEEAGLMARPEAPETAVVGDYLVDKATGDVVFDATGEETDRPMEKDATGRWRYLDSKELVFPDVEIIEEELSDMDQFDMTLKLRDRIEDANSAFKDTEDAYIRVVSSGVEPSAAGDLALIFNYMKMLDPGSTVREGEFATAQQAAGVPGRIVSLYNNVVSGERLNTTQREDFISRARTLYESGLERAELRADQIAQLGIDRGIPREDIVLQTVPVDDSAIFEETPEVQTITIQGTEYPIGEEITLPDGRTAVIVDEQNVRIVE